MDKLDEEIDNRLSYRDQDDGTQESFFSKEQKEKQEEEGIFFLSPNIYFFQSKIVVWRKYKNVVYTVVCEEEENRALVVNFLQSFPRILGEYSKKNMTSSIPSTEFLSSRPEEIMCVLNSILPNGFLQFITPNYLKQLKKEIESSLAK
eukprot:TRINITY_DN7791_c0_g1_i1.p1 TRINITY_DN7791_c0_g1~~TRINITY_DN7791_c0_g1_i1.p1  ORF type:complete len:148 (+),score=13.24 TRINITY_DN7791_c0_g1_i1:148-591(+)